MDNKLSEKMSFVNKRDANWEKIYFILFIVFLCLFAVFFVLSLVGCFESTLFWGLTGIFASFLSAAFIAWITERNANKTFVEMRKRIIKFCTRELNRKIINFIYELLLPDEIVDKYYKPIYPNNSFNIDNLIYNVKFLVFIRDRIEKDEDLGKQLNFKMENITAEKLKNTANFFIKYLMEIEGDIYSIIEEIEKQNTFNHKPIFAKDMYSIFIDLRKTIVGFSLSKMNRLRPYEPFFHNLAKYIQQNSLHEIITEKMANRSKEYIVPKELNEQFDKTEDNNLIIDELVNKYLQENLNLD